MKKPLIILIAALLAAVLTGFFHGRGKVEIPERVSVYLVNDSRIITVPYRDYIAGCVLAVAPPACGTEGLKAIACAINSTVISRLSSQDRRLYCGADFCDNEKLCPAYITTEKAAQQYSERYPTLVQNAYSAADYGIAHALTYDGAIVTAPVCRFSTGLTDEGGSALPHIESVKIPADEGVDEALSTRAFTEDTVRNTLAAFTGISSLASNPASWFSDAQYLESGTLSQIKFGGKAVSGAQLRDIFGLRSAAVAVEYAESRFVLSCRGWGDNLGLSTNAAAVMARGGNTAEEILAYFYPLAELSRI